MVYFFDVTENMIWHEFCLAFCYNKRIRAYIDHRKKLNRISNWVIITISTVSALSYWNDTKLGAVLSGAAAVALIVKELLPIFNQSETDLLELSKAATFFSSYQTKMEQLYVKLKFENCHPAFLEKDFFKIKQEASQYITITNEYYRGLPKKIDKRINTELENYVREIYSESSEPEL